MTEAKLFTMRAHGKQGDGVRTDVAVRNFNLVLDEPTQLGGTDTGPNPMEYVLSALLGCASVMLRIVGTEQGLDYDSASFDIRGTIDLRGLEGVPDICRHFQKVTGTVTVGTDDSVKLANVAAAIESRCPVFNLLKDAGVDITLTWKAANA